MIEVWEARLNSFLTTSLPVITVVNALRKLTAQSWRPHWNSPWDSRARFAFHSVIHSSVGGRGTGVGSSSRLLKIFKAALVTETPLEQAEVQSSRVCFPPQEHEASTARDVDGKIPLARHCIVLFW